MFLERKSPAQSENSKKVLSNQYIMPLILEDEGFARLFDLMKVCKAWHAAGLKFLDKYFDQMIAYLESITEAQENEKKDSKDSKPSTQAVTTVTAQAETNRDSKDVKEFKNTKREKILALYSSRAWQVRCAVNQDRLLLSQSLQDKKQAADVKMPGVLLRAHLVRLFDQPFARSVLGTASSQSLELCGFYFDLGFRLWKQPEVNCFSSHYFEKPNQDPKLCALEWSNKHYKFYTVQYGWFLPFKDEFLQNSTYVTNVLNMAYVDDEENEFNKILSTPVGRHLLRYGFYNPIAGVNFPPLLVHHAAQVNTVKASFIMPCFQACPELLMMGCNVNYRKQNQDKGSVDAELKELEMKQFTPVALASLFHPELAFELFKFGKSRGMSFEDFCEQDASIPKILNRRKNLLQQVKTLFATKGNEGTMSTVVAEVKKNTV
jgi:hypothetical protein